MEDKETLEAIGQLIARAHKDRYPSRRQFAFAADIDVKTITSAEKGERELHPNTMRSIEKALGWRNGSIEEVWAHRDAVDPEMLTVEAMGHGADTNGLPPGNDAPQPSRASQLTDEELLAELSIRFWGYKVRATRR